MHHYTPQGLTETVTEHVRLQCPGLDADRWLYPRVGEHQNVVRYDWRRTRDTAGLSYKLHDQRHFYASGLDRGRVRCSNRQRALGKRSAAESFDT